MPAALACCLLRLPHVDCGSCAFLSWLQHDLTDAVAWAIENKIADPARVAIYGGSYGEQSLRTCQRSSEALQQRVRATNLPCHGLQWLVHGSGSLCCL